MNDNNKSGLFSFLAYVLQASFLFGMFINIQKIKILVSIKPLAQYTSAASSGDSASYRTSSGRSTSSFKISSAKMLTLEYTVYYYLTYIQNTIEEVFEYKFGKKVFYFFITHYHVSLRQFFSKMIFQIF